jgi:hypothetical protein
MIDKPPSAARFYQVLGRVMEAIRSSSLLSGVQHLDWWPSQGRREWHIEWKGGPFPHELAAVLIQEAADPEHGCRALRERMGPLPQFRSDGRGRAVLTIDGVPVHLLAWQPVGAEESFRQVLTGLDQRPR